MAYNDFAPYGDFSPYVNPAQGETGAPYNEHIPNYGAPGPLGQSINRGLAGSFNFGTVESMAHPGLVGIRNAVSFDIASNQLYMRRGGQPGAQSSTPIGGYNGYGGTLDGGE